MRFWLVVSWRHSWERIGMDIRAIADKDEARRVAEQYNAVLIEIYDGGIQTYVDAHDWEFRDDKGQPAPARWTDVAVYFHGGHGLASWGPAPSPVVRVGLDIERKKYEEMVADG